MKMTQLQLLNKRQHALAIVWRDVAKAKVFDLITYVRNVNIDV